MPALASDQRRAAAVLAVWADADPAAEPDFNEWYNREHLVERADIAGFFDGRRYVAVSPRTRPRYLALYDTVDAAVLDSPAYRERLDNPTPWTERVMPGFRNFTRAVLGVRARFGRGHGGIVATVRPRGPGGLSQRLREWLVDEALPQAVAAPGMVAADLLGTIATEAPDTTERRLRHAPDKTTDWAVILEAANLDALRREMAARLSRAAFGAHESGPVDIGMYRMAAVVGHRSR